MSNNQTHSQVFGHLTNAWLDIFETSKYLDVKLSEVHKHIAAHRVRCIMSTDCKLRFSLKDLKAVKIKISQQAKKN